MRASPAPTLLDSGFTCDLTGDAGVPECSAPRKERTATGLLAAALMLSASPLGIAVAQVPPGALPPVVVDAPKAKRKAPPKKAAVPYVPPAPTVAPAPSPAPEAAPAPAAPTTLATAPPGAFRVDQSASPKMTAPLLNTPQTVVVIPGTVIQQRGATTLTEILRNTPGISFSAGENGFSTGTNNFQIRGFDTSGSIFIDGVRDSGSYTRDSFNVAGVEVVKGPAADNGRGTAGGYINIITKTPTLENFVAGETSLGFDEYNSDIRSRATIDVNQVFGTTAVRLNGMIEDGGVAGRDIAEANGWGLAPSIAFGLGTPFRAIFSYEHLERDDLPDWGVPAHMIKGMFRFNPIAAQASRDNFYGLRTDFDRVTSDAAMARFEYSIAPDVTITNQTRWSETDRTSRFTFPTGFTPIGNGGTVATTLNFYDRTNTSLSNQTNLSAKFSLLGFKHSIATGFEYMHEESEANRFGTIANPGGATDIFNPNPGRFGSAPFSPTQVAKVEVDTIAGYFFDTIDITRNLQLTGGVRLESYDVNLNSRTITGAPTGVGDFEDSHTTLGGKIGLVYKPVSNGSLYASYGVSALPPGSYLSNPDISRTGDNAFPGLVLGADPIEMHNYEVGVKWDFFGGRLSTTAAAFHTVKKDIPYNAVTANNIAAGDPPIVYGEQIVEGIELGIAGSLTPRWKAFGGLLIMESERKHGRDVDRAQTDYNGNLVTTNGQELSFTPKVSAALWSTYDITQRLTLGAGVQYVGDSWLGRPDDAQRIIPNGTFGKLPDYLVANFMSSYKLTDNLDLRLNIDNVFDETYAMSANWPGQRVMLGAPRTFRIGTSFKY